MNCFLPPAENALSDDTLAAGVDTTHIKWLMDSVGKYDDNISPSLPRIRYYRSCGITVHRIWYYRQIFSFFSHFRDN